MSDERIRKVPEPVKDLPDPLEETPKTEASNPDDLIAQMAEQAIDDMIAAADREAPADRAPATEDPPQPASDASTDPIAATPAETSPLADIPVSETPTPSADAPVQPTAGLQSQLDNLFTTLDKAPDPAPNTPEADPSAESPDAPSDTHADTDDAPAPQPLADIAEPRADVRALLDDAVHSAPRFGAPRFVIKLLELINAPFADLPDGVRDTLGQIAIITLVNALAVLLYVILFRN